MVLGSQVKKKRPIDTIDAEKQLAFRRSVTVGVYVYIQLTNIVY